jgi:hypothetical protein
MFPARLAQKPSSVPTLIWLPNDLTVQYNNIFFRICSQTMGVGGVVVVVLNCLLLIYKLFQNE